MARIVQPFAGEPHTRQEVTEDGGIEFTITASTITPDWAEFADALCWGLMLLGILIACVHIPSMRDATLGTWAFGIGAPIALRYWFESDIRDLFRSKTEFWMSRDYFAIKRNGDWDTFDRRLSLRFALVEHDQALEEKRRLDYEQQRASMNRQAVRSKPYYGDSYIVVAEYFGQRHDLLAVYGRKEALAIVARFQACNEIIEAAERRGRGVSTAPDTQWGDQPGDL